MASWQEKEGYKSPVRKLVSFFKKSRDQWKSKFSNAKKELKRLQNRVRFLEKSKKEWKQKANELKAENARLNVMLNKIETKPPEQKKTSEPTTIQIAPSFFIFPRRHYYSLGLITLSILLTLSASAGLRCVGKILEVMNQFIEIPRSTPSWCSGRLWLLRVGYYKLTRRKETADDWVWIVDHTIQSGNMKCLAVLGLRLSSLKGDGKDKKLSHADVEPITLSPVTQSNGDIVYQQLEETIQKTGVPRQIVGDRGSDLKAGINKFIENHPKTDFIFDIKHFTALMLEKEFKSDIMWIEFIKWASETRNSLRQTPLSHLKPPNQRAKSRYMNMDTLVDWGVKILSLFDRMEENQDRDFDIDTVTIRKKIDWILDFKKEIAEWNQIMKFVGKTESFVRTHGLFQGCDKKLRSILHFSPNTPERVIRIRWSLIEHVLDESLKAKPGEQLLGSSEVVESVFGKFKYMQGEHARSELGGLVLAIPAMVSEITQDVVKSALETVPVKEVRTWIKEKFGKSARAKRKEAFFIPAKTEQKADQFLIPA